MIKSGGYCDGYGYGFVDHIHKKYKFDKNITVKNYGDFPSVEGYFYDIKKIVTNEYSILINVTDNILATHYLKKNYSILEKIDQCYLVKLK